MLLTGKSLYCQKHGIHLTTVADGTVLAGVSPMDLCTLVGNALDNAIESVKKIEDREKRLIHVAVSRQKNFALLRFENCFEGELTFENGLPRTTKGNTDYHGYGLKSIRRTAQKYGGTVTVNTRKNWFDSRSCCRWRKRRRENNGKEKARLVRVTQTSRAFCCKFAQSVFPFVP